MKQHKQLKSAKVFSVDAKIRPIVRWLNRHWIIETEWSCQAGPGSLNPHPYVTFRVKAGSGDDWLEFLTEFNNLPGVMYGINAWIEVDYRSKSLGLRYVMKFTDQETLRKVCKNLGT